MYEQDSEFLDMDEDARDDMFRTIPKILQNVILTGKPKIQSSGKTIESTKEEIPVVSGLSITDYHPNGYGPVIQAPIVESEENDMGLFKPKKNNSSIVEDVKKKQEVADLKKTDVTENTKQVTVEQVEEFITSNKNKSEGLGTINGYNIQPVSSENTKNESTDKAVVTTKDYIAKITDELEEMVDSDTLSDGEKIAILSLANSKSKILLKERFGIAI